MRALRCAAASATAPSSVPAPARDGVCAVSCSGQVEIFIRRVAAYDLAARISYGGQTLQEAAQTVVFEPLSSRDIGAGMVVLDATGDVLAPYNTLGLYRMMEPRCG